MEIQKIGYMDFVDLDSGNPARIFVTASVGGIHVSMYIEKDGDFEFDIDPQAADALINLLQSGIAATQPPEPNSP